MFINLFFKYFNLGFDHFIGKKNFCWFNWTVFISSGFDDFVFEKEESSSTSGSGPHHPDHQLEFCPISIPQSFQSIQNLHLSRVIHCLSFSASMDQLNILEYLNLNLLQSCHGQSTLSDCKTCFIRSLSQKCFIEIIKLYLFTHNQYLYVLEIRLSFELSNAW